MEFGPNGYNLEWGPSKDFSWQACSKLAEKFQGKYFKGRQISNIFLL